MFKKLALLSLFMCAPLLGAESIKESGSFSLLPPTSKEKFDELQQWTYKKPESTDRIITKTENCHVIIERSQGKDDIRYTQTHKHLFAGNRPFKAEFVTFNPEKSLYASSMELTNAARSTHYKLALTGPSYSVTNPEDIEVNGSAKEHYMNIERNYFKMVAKKQAASKGLLAKIGLRSSL